MQQESTVGCSLRPSRRAFLSGGAALLGTASALTLGFSRTSMAASNDKLAMNGLFYGIDAPCDSSGNSVYKYRRPTAVRFRAELSGTIIAVRWNHRYNYAERGETDAKANYSYGTGGTIRIEMRRDDPRLEHPPLAPSTNATEKFAPLLPGDPNLLGRTLDRSGLKSLGAHPTLNFIQPVPVVAGQRYWCVFNQLSRNEWVSVNSAHIKGWTPGNTRSVGGPYYGDSWHIARSGTNSKYPVTSWLYENGTFTEESRHLVKVQFLYRLSDGRQIWSGFGSVFAHGAKGMTDTDHGSQHAFSDRTPIRMQFTPKRTTFRTSRLWWRAYRRLSERVVPGPMSIRLYRGTTLLGSWSSPAASWVKSLVGDASPTPPPIPFVAIELGQAVEIRQGQLHHLVFGAVSGEYVTHAQQVASDFTCRNTFLDGYAQYSLNGGASWNNGWHFGSSTTRRDFVLPFAFEVSA